LDNDIVWNKDSNFTSGWSLQYHTVRYKSLKEAREPRFIKWVGKHFPTLDKADPIVCNSRGIGQNIITPGILPPQATISVSSWFWSNLGGTGNRNTYSVIYDGNIITGDDRDVDRNNFFLTGGVGIYYHYYDIFSIHATINPFTNLLKEDSIPDPHPGRVKTEADVSFGAFINLQNSVNWPGWIAFLLSDIFCIFIKNTINAL